MENCNATLIDNAIYIHTEKSSFIKMLPFRYDGGTQGGWMVMAVVTY